MYIKKPLKIFVDGYLLNKEPQGTQTYIKELYKEFSNQNENVDIFIGSFKDIKLEQEFNYFPRIQFINYKSKSRLYRMLFEIPKIITKQKFDYAHFQYVIPFNRNKKCKYIVTIHDILFNDFKEFFSIIYRLKRNFLFKYSAKKSNFLITVSEYSKKRLIENYNLHNKYIYITPNGVNKEYLKSYDKQKSKKYIKDKYGIKNYILYVSRIEPRKNQQILLDIFSNIEDCNLQLVFIGDITIKNKSFNMSLNNMTQNRVKKIYHLKNINDNDLLYFYRASNFFIYPSKAEGFGIPPIEAGALKIPVLCSNKTALQDFDFFSPYHVDVNNQSQFKKKALDLITNNHGESLIKIYNFIKKNYTWRKSSEVLSSIIKQTNNNRDIFSKTKNMKKYKI